MTNNSSADRCVVHYKTARINGLDIFYREAGAKNAPVILLLHGSPTSSSQFRNLIPRLAASFRLIAPDYPGYGQSSMPDRTKFAYTFDNFAMVDQLLGQHGVSQYPILRHRLRAQVGYHLALLAV